MPDDPFSENQTYTGYVSTTTGTASLSTSLGSEWISLHHGSDLETLQWIAQNGIDFERMKKYCPGSWAFWSSTSVPVAMGYADLNAAVNMKGAIPAVLSFKLPSTFVANLLTATPPMAGQEETDSAYYFLPSCFPAVSATMTDCNITMLADLEFDE